MYLYNTENYKTRLKLKAAQINRKPVHISKTEDLRCPSTQGNPFQNANDIFCQTRKCHPKINTNSQRNLNSQNNLEKEKQSRGYHIS